MRAFTLFTRPKAMFSVSTAFVAPYIETMIFHGVGCDRDEVACLRCRTQLRDVARVLMSGDANAQHDEGCKIALAMTDEQAHAIKRKSRVLA